MDQKMNINLDEKILEEIYKKARSAAKQSATYQKLTKRKYRPLRGYENWLDIMLEFAIAIEGSAKGVTSLGLNPLLLMTLKLISSYQEKHSNTYWLDEDLARTLQDCDIPEKINELPSAIQHGLLLLPCEYAPRDQEGDSINWILFSKMFAGEQFPKITIGKQSMPPHKVEENAIFWVGQTRETALYSGVITEDFNSQAVNPIGGSDAHSVVKKISNLLLQSLLIAQWYPEYTEVHESGVGFQSNAQKSVKKENAWLNPKFIGDLYKKQRTKVSAPLLGTHASPVRHTRRGHWRNQACGVQWSEHRMILIEPTDVNRK